MVGLDKARLMAGMLAKHQEKCGPLEQSHDGKEIRCTVCGTKVVKAENEAVIEGKGYRLGIL